MFESALRLMEANVSEINRLNVFPVPDGDTGTNMYLTVLDVVANTGRAISNSAAETARVMASAALDGGRGNSGVLLSQFFMGMSEALSRCEDFGAEDFERTLEAASVHAYGGIGHPREGTILSVMRESAEAARNARPKGLADLLDTVCAAALDSVTRTPSMPGAPSALRTAGLVDSGGYGFYVMLEGIRRRLSAHDLDLDEELTPPEGQISDEFLDEIEEEEFGYCTQFMVEGAGLDLTDIKAKLSDLGDSPVVVGIGNRVRIHVHALDPEPVLQYGRSLGEVSKENIQNMDEQREQYSADRRAELSIEDVSVVAVVQGDGLEEVFRSYGVEDFISGGDNVPWRWNGMAPIPVIDRNEFQRLALQRLREREVSLLLSTTVAGAIVEDGAVRGVFVETPEGRRAVLARVVVDTTGEADVAAAAGAETDERHASDESGMGLFFRVEGVDWEEYEAFRAINPSVVLTSVTVFGQEGPYSRHKAYALNGSCAGGAAHRIGDPDRHPLAMPYSRADLWGGLNAAPAVLLALLARRRDGPGQHVDIAAADAMNDFGNGGDMIAYAADGYETRRHGMHTPISYPYSVLPCKDGHVSMILGNEHHWQRLLDIMGRPEWTKDPRFQSRTEIGALYAKEVDEHLKEFLAGFTKDEFWKMCRENGLPWHAAQTVEDVLAWDLLEGRGYWREAEDGGGRRWRLPGPLFGVGGANGGEPDAPDTRAPRLGEHNGSVLGGLLGLGADRVADLRRAEVVS